MRGLRRFVLAWTVLSATAALAQFKVLDAYKNEERSDNRIWCRMPTSEQCFECLKVYPASAVACQVQYLSDQERAALKVTYDPKTHLFTGPDGKPFDTGGHKGLYVVDPDNAFVFYVKAPYVERTQDKPSPHQGRLHHSSLLAARPVAMAGMISFKDGRLVTINNTSGHYRPTDEALAKLLAKLAIPKDKYPYTASGQSGEVEPYEALYVPFLLQPGTASNSPP